MHSLPRTEQALADVIANRPIMFGVHDGEEIRAGSHGVYIGERPFDPARDSVDQINPLSVWETITDEPHVALTIPEHPLHVNVVTHERQQPAQDLLGIIPTRRRLAAELTEALYDAMPGMSDRVSRYAVGEAATQNDEVEAVVTDGQPETDVRQVAELCQNGLTFVLSDFLKLPLEKEANERSLPATVAVKMNHPLDLALPAGVGRIASGYGGGEINTNDSKQLQAVNARMAAAHEHTLNRLQASGLAVAHLVLNAQMAQGAGYQEADQSLAKAITDITPR